MYDVLCYNGYASIIIVTYNGEEKIMFCQNCGNQYEDGARFCAYCGAELSAAVPVYTQLAPESFGQARSQAAPCPVTLFMKPKASVINYIFDVVDENGNLLYKAETQAQGMHYGAHVCDAYGRELLSLRQGSKASLVTMMFELYRNGALIGHVNQRVEKMRYVYEIAELGIFTESDTYACNLNISRNGYPIAAVTKKKTSMTDKYTVTVNDPCDTELVLALVMVVQIAVMRSRRSNSRLR